MKTSHITIRRDGKLDYFSMGRYLAASYLEDFVDWFDSRSGAVEKSEDY